jgi:hypothetical protein
MPWRNPLASGYLNRNDQNPYVLLAVAAATWTLQVHHSLGS